MLNTKQIVGRRSGIPSRSQESLTQTQMQSWAGGQQICPEVDTETDSSSLYKEEEERAPGLMNRWRLTFLWGPKCLWIQVYLGKTLHL